MLLLMCPHCKNTMKYQGTGKSIEKKRKRCVYCGFSMSVAKSIVKQL